MIRNNKFLTGLVAGAVIGAVAGLLLAPKSGKETRELLKEQTSPLREKAKASASDIKERASQLGGKAKDSFSSTFGKGQGEEVVETSAPNGSARPSA